MHYDDPGIRLVSGWSLIKRKLREGKVASLAARFDMVPFEAQIAGFAEADIRVLSFSGSEQLSSCFDYTFDLICPRDDLLPDQMIGLDMSVCINNECGEVQRFLHGIILNFVRAGSNQRSTLYQARLVPHLHLLGYRQDIRIFQDMTVPDIIDAVLSGAGLSDFTLALNGNYAQRDYCVQYRESDLNFIMRLMEDEGLWYFFDHNEKTSILTVVDAVSAHPDLPLQSELLYHDTGGGLADGEFVFNGRFKQQLANSAVVMRDFNFKKPNVDHLHAVSEQSQAITLEHYEYPGVYDTSKAGGDKVEKRLEALRAQSEYMRASSTARRLMPGYRFQLSDHPHEDENVKYLILSTQLAGRSPQALEQDTGSDNPGFTCNFVSVPANISQRVVDQARRPRIDGVQTAIVTGPAGEEIYTDEFGRVKVQFHWDRQGKYDEKSSCWIRVSQLWAGAGWGGMDIPRVGHEVIVSFEEGDPDRPLITGRVYHGLNRPPHQLPSSKAKSTIRSNSTPGGDGFNELSFDDAKGSEEIYLHAQHNTTVQTLNDKSQSVGNNETAYIGNDRKLHIGNDSSSKVERDRTEATGRKLSQTVGEQLALQVGKNYHLRTGETQFFQSSKQIVLESGQELTIRSSGGFIKIDGSGITLQGKVVNINSGGSPGSGIPVQANLAEAVTELQAGEAAPPSETVSAGDFEAALPSFTPNPQTTTLASAFDEAAIEGLPSVPLNS